MPLSERKPKHLQVIELSDHHENVLRNDNVKGIPNQDRQHAHAPDLCPEKSNALNVVAGAGVHIQQIMRKEILGDPSL